MPLRITGISDSRATVFSPEGIDLEAIAQHKQAGGNLGELPGSKAVPTPEAIDLVGADIVADATPSSPGDAPQAIARADAAFRNGAALVICGKNALAQAAPAWLLGDQRVGINAALGGAGRQLVHELHELRAGCTEVALCGNVTTAVIVEAIEQGASIEAGIERARALDMLEPDPSLDLEGIDAAIKLLAVAGAVFGSPAQAALSLAAVERDSIYSLDADLVQDRARRQATTRLVARGNRRGRLSVRFEELPQTSPLARPPEEVAYRYELDGASRLHVGRGVGYDLTAAAMVEDLRDLIG